MHEVASVWDFGEGSDQQAAPPTAGAAACGGGADAASAEAEASLALKRAVGSAAPAGEPCSGGQIASPEQRSSILSGVSGVAELTGRAPPPLPGAAGDEANDNCEGGEGDKAPRYSILVSSTERRNSKLCQGCKSVSIKLTGVEHVDCAPDLPAPSPAEVAGLLATGQSPRRGSDLDLLDMPVLHYAHSPINFDHLTSKCREGSDSEEEKGSSGDCEGSQEGEFWSEPLEQQVEVPVWLLEKLKGKATSARHDDDGEENEPDEQSDPPQADDSDADQGDEDDEGELSEEYDTIGELPVQAPQPKADPMKKRISFHDQVTGTSFEKYSTLKGKAAGGAEGKGNKKSVQLAVRSKSDGAGTAMLSSSTFWKIPMPTRKNTMMPALQQLNSGPVDDEDEQPDGEAGETPTAASLVIQTIPPKTRQSVKPPMPGGDQAGEINRRPSVLGVFSNDGAKAAGLYALPKDEGEVGELVEVKRRSIVMSTTMLNDILKAKVDDDRFASIQEEQDGCQSAEVVLPFFSAAKGAFRQCHCQTDPSTGFVIHTCMTPAATQCDNTQAFQSFVCSAWGSRRGSRKGSEDEMSEDEDESRRGSQQSGGGGGLHPPPPPHAEQRSGPSKQKRIRNASMLAIVGAAGPAPQKQNTDATLAEHNKAKQKAAEKKAVPDDSSDEERPEENELSVSFKNISADQESPNFLSPEKRGSADGVPADGDSSIPRALDQQVENDLGHRFELVEPWQLATWLKNKEVREQILTVDVRGRDGVGGHIPLSINLHTSEVVRHPESLVRQCLRNRIHHLVFTCMYSVLRARKSALAVEQAQQEAQKSGLQTYRIRISLLAGGMHAWVNHFIRISPQKALVQDFDAECWSDGGPSQGGLVHVMDALWSSGGQKALSDALTAELSTLLLTRGRESANSSRRASAEAETASPAL